MDTQLCIYINNALLFGFPFINIKCTMEIKDNCACFQ